MSVPIYHAKAELFRSLGHPVRIQVLELLQKRPHAVHELLDRLEIEQSNLSQQLAVLRRAGIIAANRTSGTVTYSLKAEHVSSIITAARQILASVHAESTALAAEIYQLEEL